MPKILTSAAFFKVALLLLGVAGGVVASTYPQVHVAFCAGSK